jgi:hypothetical protein
LSRSTPHHRAWLHLLEDDPAVPDYALYAARVYSDFAAAKKGLEPVMVTWAMLRRCTHMHKDKCSRALSWLRDHGWLQELPARRGARIYHRLTIPESDGTTPTVRRGLRAV